MKRLSFARQLVLLWALVAVLCAVLIGVIVLIMQTDRSRQMNLAMQQTGAVCQSVATRYSQSTVTRAPSSPQPGTPGHAGLMQAVLDVVLAQAPGVEGGFWGADSLTPDAPSPANQSLPAADAPGFLAYAFPTYQGSGIKRDIPQAETPLILRTLRLSAARHASAAGSSGDAAQAVIVSACPVAGASGLYAWMLTRTRAPLGEYGESLVTALAVILACILGVATLLGFALRRWKNKLATLEQALAPHPPDGARMRLPALGEPDLDKIADAFNAYVERSATLQQQAAALSAQLTQAERFGALGRLAAQVAHEIRNPLGALRLKAENALSSDKDRQLDALRFVLKQAERMETQVASLLALTQPVRIAAQAVDLRAWLAASVSVHDEQARARQVTLSIEFASLDAEDAAHSACVLRFDPEQLNRALDNLILNALRHVAPGGAIGVRASRAEGPGQTYLSIAVTDDGPGVPAAERERIFEPFVTGAAGGSGLGLAVVREVAAAHGGRAYLAAAPSGACFVIEIPWHTSS
jgi:two-component system sensor histidine kinase HydH